MVELLASGVGLPCHAAIAMFRSSTRLDDRLAQMLEIRFRRDGRERLSSILAEGHAEAGIAGDDVVCAAASAILQAAELGLSAYAALPDVASRAAGRMAFTIPEHARDREDVKAIVGTAELAIDRLAWQFPVNVRIVREDESNHAPAGVEFLGNR